MATLGYVRGSNGPDLAQVGANEQLVSHVFPNTSGQTLRLTSVSAWVGNWSGTATMRFGIWAASSSSASPGVLLARTVEFSPTTSYVDAAGGQLRTVALETPIDIAPGQVIALGVASRNNSAGIAMYQAADISRPNENFYRKGISGTNLQSASGSSVSNEGHLAIYVTGAPPPPEPEPNKPPNAPQGLLPWGEITGSLTPVFQFVHVDPDNDKPRQYRIQARRGGSVVWDQTGPYGGGTAYVAYGGPALQYYQTLEWRVRTQDSSHAWGPWSSWAWVVVRHNNRSPNKPSAFTGAGNRSGTRDVTVSAAFTDPDYPTLPNGQQWEWFDAKQVIVRRDSDNVIVYSSGVQSVSGSQRTNRRSVTSYTLPAWDTPYTHHERHRDRSGSWSDYTTVSIKAISGSSVDAPTSPSGRVTNLWNPGRIVAIYRNTAGLNANAVQLQLRNKFGTIITTSAYLPVNIAPGGTIDRPWSDLGIGGLIGGEEYVVTVQARATNGQWSLPSPRTTFVTNAAPNTPILHSPYDGFVANYLGHLQVNATDPDQPSSELSVFVELLDENNNPLGTLPMEQASGSRFRALPNSLITNHQTFKWRSYSFDGFIYSGGATSPATAAKSPLTTYVYAPVPAVDITGPAGPVITTSQPLLEWDSTGQTHWRVRGYDGSRLVYDTGERPGSAQSHVVSSSQYWIGNERWNNHETFDWIVSVRDSSTLWGSSDPLTLTLEYIPPTQLIVESVEARPLPGVKGTHYAVITTSQPDATEENFIRTVVDRVEIDGPAGAEIPGSFRGAHFESGSSADTVFTDFDMTSNQWYRWSFRYEVRSGVDVIESAPVFAEMMVSWHGTLLHMPFDPLNTFVWLPYGTERYEPEFPIIQGGSLVETMHGSAPLRFKSRMHYVQPVHEATFVPRDGATAKQQLDDFIRLVEYQVDHLAPNGRPNSVCFREGRGGRIHRLYGEITNPVPRYAYTHLASVSFEFTELGVHPSPEGGDE